MDHHVYDWRIQDELAVAAYWVGEHAQSLRLCEALLAGDALPASERARVEDNARLAKTALAKGSGG